MSDASIRRALPIVFFLLAVSSVLPFSATPYLPLIDMPQHT